MWAIRDTVHMGLYRLGYCILSVGAVSFAVLGNGQLATRDVIAALDLKTDLQKHTFALVR